MSILNSNPNHLEFANLYPNSYVDKQLLAIDCSERTRDATISLLVSSLQEKKEPKDLNPQVQPNFNSHNIMVDKVFSILGSSGPHQDSIELEIEEDERDELGDKRLSRRSRGHELDGLMTLEHYQKEIKLKAIA